ncbi:hypothetical protein PG985_005126 [Apiospora marii]|uniref:uncharacterized protein n=1 Tax=Apiospora marii TaxID=335849 RepID=UPI00312D8459
MEAATHSTPDNRAGVTDEGENGVDLFCVRCPVPAENVAGKGGLGNGGIHGVAQDGKEREGQPFDGGGEYLRFATEVVPNGAEGGSLR